MTLSIYERFEVHGVVARCANGLPIHPDSLADVAVVSHETTTDDDPNISVWGVYGALSDGSIDNIADCPTKAVADAICLALITQSPSRRAS
ncbi:MAG: hypothetical protein FD131_4610 [Rhodocyclaceae bacterium]|nr:MAG: hypothetical protein FD131_4610 [Rhodocyclaceae bacterium]